MKKQVLDCYAAELLQMVERPSLELVALKRHWPEVQRKFDKERRQLDRKIPEDDPIRLSVDLLVPLNEIHTERVHTRALAYLLDPSQDHGFRRAVLVALLEKVKEGAPRSVAVFHTLHLLKVKSISVSVTPEYRYNVAGSAKRSNACPDIWIEVRTARSAALIVIENKINACESAGQLGWYERKAREWRKAEKGRRTSLLVFLAFDQAELKSSETDDWQVFSYLDLAASLRKVWKTKRNAVGRSWLGLYIASITRGLLGLDVSRPKGSDLAHFREYLGLGRVGDV